jgi:hypothetical protein
MDSPGKKWPDHDIVTGPTASGILRSSEEYGRLGINKIEDEEEGYLRG